jgi:hypothetical protein
VARTRSDSGSRGGLRTVALVAAVLVALASTAAVVLSDDPETLRLAVVGALWAFVLAAFAAPRRREPESDDGPGSALELRRTYEIELQKEVAARREYELQLEVYLRRELERGLAEDVAALRDEVGRMRGEMIDRLDGELRMERIETTRLIGGSLQALREEASRLGIGLPVPPELTGTIDADPLSGPGGYGPARNGSTLGAADYPPTSGYQDYSATGRFAAPSIFDEPSVPPPPAAPQAGPPPPSAPPAYDYGGAYSPYPSYADPGPEPMPPPAPPAPRSPAAGESVPPRRRRAREDGEDNEVMSRLLGR